MQPLGVSQIELQLQSNTSKDAVSDTSIAGSGFVRYIIDLQLGNVNLRLYKQMLALHHAKPHLFLGADVWCWIVKLL